LYWLALMIVTAACWRKACCLDHLLADGPICAGADLHACARRDGLQGLLPKSIISAICVSSDPIGMVKGFYRPIDAARSDADVVGEPRRYWQSLAGGGRAYLRQLKVAIDLPDRRHRG